MSFRHINVTISHVETYQCIYTIQNEMMWFQALIIRHVIRLCIEQFYNHDIITMWQKKFLKISH